MQAVKGFYADGTFTPSNGEVLPKYAEAMLVFATKVPVAEPEPELDRQARVEWIKKMEASLAESRDEELPDWPFERSKEMAYHK